MHPVHKMKVKIDDRSKDIIRNPKATIHIVNGAGGNQEGLNNFMQSNIPGILNNIIISSFNLLIYICFFFKLKIGVQLE